MNMLRPKQQGTSLGAGTASATLSTAGTAGTHLNSVEGVKAKVIHEVRRRRDLRWIDILCRLSGMAQGAPISRALW